MKIVCMMLYKHGICSSSELTRGDLPLLQSVQVGGRTGGTYLMPTLFSQPKMMVPQYPWTRGEMVSALNIKLRVKILMVGAREDECVALEERGHLIWFSQDVVGYLRNPDLVCMDRSTSQSPPVKPLDNGRGDLKPSLSLASSDFFNVVHNC